MTGSGRSPDKGGGDRFRTGVSRSATRVIPSTPLFQSRFVRYECKYLVTYDQVPQIRAFLRPFMRVDPHALKSPDHTYMITSLYLDSWDFRLFRETQEGTLNRIKLRIRSYADVAEQPVFLEIKRRNNGVVNKSRSRLPRRVTEALLRGRSVDPGDLPEEEKGCCDEFIGWIGRWGAVPMVWVRYQREAYVGAVDPSIRVTIDRNLVCSPSHSESMEYGHLPWWPVENNALILELKFNRSFPSWMENMVRCLDLKRISFSKYGNSVSGGLGRWLRIPS